MSYYLVMDAWNCVLLRTEDEREAVTAARVSGGFVVPFRKGRRV